MTILGLHVVDWLLVLLPLAGLLALALRTQRYVKGASDFIAAGRCAGRYLLANAKGEAGSGVTNTVSWFEVFMIAGFITMFWSQLSVPLALIIGITGFAVYRYRETRSLTMAQFYEARYSRRFRLFMGFLAFFAGVLNYGIFPAVSARFFIYYLGVPTEFALLGLHVPTYLAIMAVYMTISCGLILFGGQVTLIVTDCVEGILSHLIYIVIIVALFCIVSWNQIVEVLTGAIPNIAQEALARSMQIQPNHSPVNPFDAFGTTDFNFTYVMLGMAGTVYGVLSWQGGHGFNAAARTPHEGRMGNILGQWRQYARTLVLVVLVICTMAYLRHPDFAAQSAPAKEEVARIAEPGKSPPAVSEEKPIGSQQWFEDKANVPQLQRQQITSVTLRHFLPVGITGLFLLVMVLGLFAGDGNHLHSWSSIFVQDVVLPIRSYVYEKRTGSPAPPLDPHRHINWLRMSVVGVAMFAFLFSWLVPLKMPIWMWWAITGAIYNAGAGAVILGGLYWKKGTTAGAWTSMLLGSTFAVSCILLNNNWSWVRDAVQPYGLTLPPTMWGSPAWHSFIAMCLALSSYLIVSMLTHRVDCDMDKLLNRGKYEVARDHVGDAHEKPTLMQKLIGIDATFSRKDKFVAGFIFWWSMLSVALCIGMVIWHYGVGAARPEWRMTNHNWAVFWGIYGLLIPFIFSAATLVWFSIGGFIDLKAFFRALETQQREATDDGAVRKKARDDKTRETVTSK